MVAREAHVGHVGRVADVLAELGPCWCEGRAELRKQQNVQNGVCEVLKLLDHNAVKTHYEFTSNITHKLPNARPFAFDFSRCG